MAGGAASFTVERKAKSFLQIVSEEYFLLTCGVLGGAVIGVAVGAVSPVVTPIAVPVSVARWVKNSP